MFEKVNPSHPDKVADRIAGAVVDYCYWRVKSKMEQPRVAVEVLLGHGKCVVMAESSVHLRYSRVRDIVERVTNRSDLALKLVSVEQDELLAENQVGKMRCGDNGIFCGMPVSKEEQWLTNMSELIYKRWPTDGKYVMHEGMLTVCQSGGYSEDIRNYVMNREDEAVKELVVNPLGDWTGGSDVDCGATNRKLGSDMGRGVTGGGLHGKDLSKADVSVNVVCHILAQLHLCRVEACCSIGDEVVEFRLIPIPGAYRVTEEKRVKIPYEEVVAKAKDAIMAMGGFEKFAEWGLIRPYEKVGILKIEN